MLRLTSLRHTLARRAVAIALAGALIGTISACSAFEQSEAVGEPVVRVDVGSGTVVHPPIPQETAAAPAEPSLQRRLADLLTGVAGRAGGTGSRDDGYIRDGASVALFEVDHPAIANLAPALLDAVRRAAEYAREFGIEVRVGSGWRSAQYQQALLDEAISEYGSWEEARRYVNTPDQSTHVTGQAVDIAPTDAAYWMQQYGAAYGLCQTYANEVWHYELTVEPGGTCPAPLPDASGG